MIEFRADERTASGYLAIPEQGSGPGIIVIQEYWGLVDHIKDVADRFAAQGFVALAPDLYHGDATTSPDEAGRKMMALDIAQAGRELSGAADELLGRSEVTSSKVGLVGFCMGGQLALLAGTEHADKVFATVDFYGVHPNISLDFTKLQAPVLGHFAIHDEFVPEANARALAAQIEQAGREVEAHFYEVGHAFFNDARPEAYREAEARLAWERTLTFLRSHVA